MASTSFGDFLRYFRLRTGLTQGELAERSGVSVRAIRDMERGRAQSPRRRTVELLARGLNLSDLDLRVLLKVPGDGGVSARPADVFGLPPAIPDLTGRADVLTWLAGRADRAATATSSDVVVLHGSPGIGKTTVAVQAGHRFGRMFPDGCFFVDMLGMRTRPLDSADAARQVLTGLGVAADAVPAAAGRRLDLYRSLLGNHSVLLILDNAADEAQVRPLLAASPGSMVLVTSRNALVGLDAAARREVGLLASDQAVALLAAISGRDRVTAEADAAEKVAELCGGVPLALRIAGNLLTADPSQRIARFAERLLDERGRLDTLTAGTVQVKAAFELSYRLLDQDAARVFRGLALIPGPDAGIRLAAVAGDLPEGSAEAVLEQLVDVGLLLTSPKPGRYTYHDLLRVFAALKAEESGEVAETRHRMHEWLLDTAASGARHFHPDEPPSDADRTAFTDREEALRWLDAETENWHGAFRQAAREQRHQRVLDLATAMHWYSDYRGNGSLWENVYSSGASAAEALGSTRDVAVQLNFLCWAQFVLLYQHEEALATHDRALRAAVEVGDLLEQAWAWLYRGYTEQRLRMYDSAVTAGQRAIALFAEAGYDTGYDVAESMTAALLRLVGRLEESARLHQRSIDRYRDRVHVGNSTGAENLGMMYLRYAGTLLQMGRHDEALAALDESERLFVDRQSAAMLIAHVKWIRGQVLIELGQDEVAMKLLLEALEYTGRRGPEWTTRALSSIVRLSERLGDHEMGTELRVRALARYPEYDLAEIEENDTVLEILLRGEPA
ncbi:MAG: NB-ARC domain-containing protein [Kibdelosporangium sp.]